jgi:hypothetical protein
MTLTMAAESLHTKLRRLRDAATSLQTTIMEDQPLTGECILTGVLSDDVDAWNGWLDEIINAAPGTIVGSESEKCQALGRSHQIFTRLEQHFFDELISRGRLESLAQLAQERGGEWCGWSEEVRESLRECCALIIELNETFLHCWQELMPPAPGASVSRQRTEAPFRVLTGGQPTSGKCS